MAMVNSAAESLLDFESSIQAELQAELGSLDQEYASLTEEQAALEQENAKIKQRNKKGFHFTPGVQNSRIKIGKISFLPQFPWELKRTEKRI